MIFNYFWSLDVSISSLGMTMVSTLKWWGSLVPSYTSLRTYFSFSSFRRISMTFWMFLPLRHLAKCSRRIYTSSCSSSFSWSFPLSFLGGSWCLLWLPCSGSWSTIARTCSVLLCWDWNISLEKKSIMWPRGVGPWLVLGTSWNKGFLVCFRFIEKCLWTRGNLTSEGDREISLNWMN